MRCVFQFTKCSAIWLAMLGEFLYSRKDFATGYASLRGLKAPTPGLVFTCVCSSRPRFSQKFWGKVLQGTESLHSTEGRKAPSGIAFWSIVQLPEKVEGFHQSGWSKTSWDALPVWVFGEPCLRIWVAKLPSALLEETQLCS